MDYDQMIRRMKRIYRNDQQGVLQLQSEIAKDCNRAGNAIKELLARAEKAESENAVLRKMQPVRLDDTGAKVAALAAEVSELRQKLAQAEQACAYYKYSMESYRDGAKARYKLLNEARERANEACSKWEYRAKKAEEDRDRLREAMKPNCIMCDSMHENGNCTEVGGFCTAVPAAHCPLIPRLITRAEKAEKERDAAVEQLRGDCEKCANYKVTWNGCTPDFECPLSDRCLNRDMWEWNGGQKEE